MDLQIFVDRLLETENLTDALDDAEADWLLNWGVGQVARVTQGCADEDQAGEKVNALMSFMRRANRLAARKASRTPQALQEELAALGEIYLQAFGARRSLVGEELEVIAGELKALPVMDTLARLVKMFA